MQCPSHAIAYEYICIYEYGGALFFCIYEYGGALFFVDDTASCKPHGMFYDIPFRKRANDCRALLRDMGHKDKASYVVAKTHRMPHLCRSFPAKEPYN